MKSSTLSEQTNNICRDTIAVIDIGTNTIRLLIGYNTDNRVIRLINKRCVTRLGRDLLRTGILNSESIKKSIECLSYFKLLIEMYKINRIIAVGTSALREASNSSNFLSTLERETGIIVKIISGEKEAELTIKGVLASYKLKEDCQTLVIDIGGGSTEWILYSEQLTEIRSEKMKLGSIPIGAVKLNDKFIRHDPPTLEELELMKAYIEDKIKEGLSDAQFLDNQSLSLIATGGTATTIAAIDIELEDYNGDRVHMHSISRPTLINILNKFQRLTYKDRGLLKGLEPERADIIIPGAFILLTIMDILNLNIVNISDYGLLEGLLIESGFRL